MSFYIIIVNGLDLMVTGPFNREELAMEKEGQIKHLTDTRIVRCSKSIKKLYEFTPWSEFEKSEWVK